MRKFLTLTAAFMLLAASSSAGTLTSATWQGAFQGTPITVTVSGITGTATGTAIGPAGVSLTVGPDFQSVFDGSGAAPVFISQTLGGSQTINSSNVANQGIGGAVNVFIGTGSGGLLLFPVGLSVGVGGNFNTAATIGLLGSAPVTVTATFFPWTSGTQVLTGLSSTTTTTFTFMGQVFSSVMMGVALPDATFSGTNTLVGGVGSITLVSPSKTAVCVGSGGDTVAMGGTGACIFNNPTGNNTQNNTTASATSLKLNFAGGGGGAVPEPGTILLLGAGLVGLVAVGRRQRS